MSKAKYFNIQNILLFATIMVLGASFYLEYSQGMLPCPLCFMQRLSAFIFGLTCLIGLFAFSLYRARRIVAFQMFFAVAGLFFSLRQVWLQFFTQEQSSMCMPAFNTLWHYVSWSNTLKMFFLGAPDCGESTWRLLGLTIPAWSALYFFAILVASFIIFCGLCREIKHLSSQS